MGCRALSRITLPAGVAALGGRAFSGCTSLSAIALPASLCTIGEECFHTCRGLTAIALPEGLYRIGARAFFGCAALTEAAIPDSVMRIGHQAFCNCKTLTSLSLPVRFRRELARIIDTAQGKRITYSAPELAGLSPEFIVDGTILVDYTGQERCLHLPEGITAIAEGCFTTEHAIHALHLPASLQTLEEGVLSELLSLDEITVAEGNRHFKVNDGILTSANGDILYRVCTHFHGWMRINCRRVGDGAAYMLSEYTDLILGADVREIGNFAFMGCGMLEYIEVAADHNGDLTIGEGAFDECPRLCRIMCPASLVDTFRAACPGVEIRAIG